MSRTIIKEGEFPEIVRQYNSGGKSAAYEMIRDRYGVKNPYFVLARIRRCRRYTYDSETDQFIETDADQVDGVFMDLDELCGTAFARPQDPISDVVDSRPAAMEKLVHELISDRLLMLSRYITLDSSARRVLIDQTSLTADGYQIVTH